MGVVAHPAPATSPTAGAPRGPPSRGFEKDEGRRFAEVQSEGPRERRAFAIARRLESVETGECAEREGVRTTRQRRVEHPAADQIGGQRDGARAGGAGGHDRGLHSGDAEQSASIGAPE